MYRQLSPIPAFAPSSPPLPMASRPPVIAWLQQQLRAIEIRTPHQARWICRLVPASCPFARDIRWGQFTLLHIPPLCQLNPLYEQLMELRFKALCYLADS
jgi:hypothetical protein